MSQQNQTPMFKVVVNHEDQFSIWWNGRENPPGWRDVNKRGTKNECLAYIKERWTDMRPLSVRQSMDQVYQQPIG